MIHFKEVDLRMGINIHVWVFLNKCFLKIVRISTRACELPRFSPHIISVSITF